MGIIRMQNHKMITVLLGLALTAAIAQAAKPTISYKTDGSNIIITYTGELYLSEDAISWSKLESASNPYQITMRNKKLFFCSKETSDNKNFTIQLSDTVSLDMIWIEPGTFMMGSPEDELGRDPEKETLHEVTLTTGYWVGKYEVTQSQYEAVMGTNPSRNYGVGDEYPVYYVSWNDAMDFCAKLTETEKAAGRLPGGYEYTLPTEAQWEYACRAGTTTALNNGKNLSDMDECLEMDEVGWYGYNSDRTSHPAGEKKPNDWNLYDMHGNVQEWCFDWGDEYPTSPVVDPTGPEIGYYRVLRGGSRSNRAYACRSAYRTYFGSDYTANNVGFRVALAKVPTKDMVIPLSDTVNLELVGIQPGTFMMGSPEDELGRSNDETQHQVTLTQAFWIGKYPVTQAQYEAVIGSNPAYFKGADLPVECVSWDDSRDFCAKLTEIERAAGRLPEGYKYDLPTEAQWEYACRAGTTTALNTGKNLTDATHCPNMDEAGWSRPISESRTHPVGMKLPNNWGIYDMHGNVHEWCLDWYAEYPATAVTDPRGPDEGSYHVERGGSWYDNAYYCRSAHRAYDKRSSQRWNNFGFRIVLTPVK